MVDWESMGRVFTQTRGRAFQSLDRAFSFLLNPQKLGWTFQRLCYMFWKKCLGESFDQQTHYEFLIIWSVKSSLCTSKVYCYKSSDIYFQLWNVPFRLNLFLFSLPFFLFQILVIKSRFWYFTSVTNATNWDVTCLVP